MTKKKTSKTASDVLKTLHESLMDSEPDFSTMPSEKLNAYLKDNDIDSKPIFNMAQEKVRAARVKLELERGRRKQLVLQKLLEKGKGSLKLAKEEIVRIIQKNVGDQQAMVYMRKFEEAPDEDLASLIEDMELLEQLELEDDK